VVLAGGFLPLMHTLRSIFALVVLLVGSWSQTSNGIVFSHSLEFLVCSKVLTAHSTTARPLKRVANPSTRSLEILPRNPYVPPPTNLSRRLPSPHPNTLRYDDSFRLIISAYDEIFHLHLRPNDHLVHPAARVDYYKTLADGREVLSHSEPLLRQTVRAYLGEVVAEYHSLTRMREDAARVYPQPHPANLGWARIMVHHEGDADSGIAPVFEGAFSARGVVYHIMTKENYLRHKQELDPSPEALNHIDSRLVVWRESDEMSLEEEHFAKTGSHPTKPIIAPQSCGHDRLQFNDPTQNPMLSMPVAHSWIEGLINPFLNDTVYRRDDAPVGSNGMGTKSVISVGFVDIS